MTRNPDPRRTIATAVVAVLVSLLAGAAVTSTSLADDSQEMRFGSVETVTPVEIKGGFMGLSKKAGRAYGVAIVDGGGQIQIESSSLSFLVGDCVAVIGDGKKTSLERADPKQCGKTSAAAPAGNGVSRDDCPQARDESKVWPPESGRHRALLRELIACGGDSNLAHPEDAAAPKSGACSAAWAEVERLPFGPARADARRRAVGVCGDG